MTTLELLGALARLNVRFSIRFNGGARVLAPRGVLSAEHRQLLVERTAEVAAIVRKADDAMFEALTLLDRLAARASSSRLVNVVEEYRTVVRRLRVQFDPLLFDAPDSVRALARRNSLDL